MKRWILSSLIIITTLSCSVKTFGQVKHFESLDMSNGLSSSTVYSIAQDDYGFIWIGTKNGLNIYNGIDFRSFYAEPDNEFSLPGNQIEKILMNGDTAYIGTQSGLCMMNVISKECIQIDIGINLRIRTLYLEKKNGILWIGTQKGLIKYSISSNAFTRLFKTEMGISPQKFVKKKRIDIACVLLHHFDYSIDKIAADTGFADRYHFSKNFKKITGLSPASYRKEFGISSNK